jgi:hypothetical protein
VYGRYNWTLGAAWAARAGRESPYLIGRNVSRVLALSPEVDLRRTRTWAEFAAIIAGLLQVHVLRVCVCVCAHARVLWGRDRHFWTDRENVSKRG